MPSTGYIQLRAYTSTAHFPLKDVAITVTATDGTAIAMRLTDRNGLITPIEIPVPDNVIVDSTPSARIFLDGITEDIINAPLPSERTQEEVVICLKMHFQQGLLLQGQMFIFFTLLQHQVFHML